MRVKELKFGAIVGVVLAVSGCVAVPKAPTLSGGNRAPVNNQTAVELQSCKGDLSNTKILLHETARLADSASSALSQMTMRCAAPPKSAPTAVESPAAVTFMPTSYKTADSEKLASTSTVFVLQFPYASTSVNLTDESAIALGEAAKHAQLIVVRGRTDGVVDTPGETRVAKARAEAVAAYLSALGVDRSRIRETFQPVGDHVADNATEDGRAKNRRAEVEVYPSAPGQLALIAKTGR